MMRAELVLTAPICEEYITYTATGENLYGDGIFLSEQDVECELEHLSSELHTIINIGGGEECVSDLVLAAHAVRVRADVEVNDTEFSQGGLDGRRVGVEVDERERGVADEVGERGYALAADIQCVETARALLHLVVIAQPAVGTQQRVDVARQRLRAAATLGREVRRVDGHVPALGKIFKGRS